MKDYRSYKLDWGERLKYGFQALLLTAFLDYLFYASVWVMAAAPAVIGFYLKRKREQLGRRRRKRIGGQFRDMLGSLCVALRAGYSMENALGECRKDLEKLYGREAELAEELRYMQGQLAVSVPVERLLQELGERTGVEDIESFAGVYAIAKRTGGNLEKVLRSAAGRLHDKMEVAVEIEASLAAKRMEQRVMGLMPCAIILYLRLLSPGFLDPLYGNPAGAAAMTFCLAVYAAALRVGERIVEIEV